MIEMYDIPVSQINNIKAGQGYTLSDGTYVPNEQLVTPADKPRSYAYCSDTAPFPEEARCIDNGLAVLQYPRATCTVRTTSLEANGYHRRQLVVCGTKGTVEIKPMENPTKMSVAWRASSGGPGAPDAREWIDIPDFGGRYDAQLIDFARMVRGETENPFGYDHELAVERTVLRACGISLGDQP